MPTRESILPFGTTAALLLMSSSHFACCIFFRINNSAALHRYACDRAEGYSCTTKLVILSLSLSFSLSHTHTIQKKTKAFSLSSLFHTRIFHCQFCCMRLCMHRYQCFRSHNATAAKTVHKSNNSHQKPLNRTSRTFVAKERKSSKTGQRVLFSLSSPPTRTFFSCGVLALSCPLRRRGRRAAMEPSFHRKEAQ